MTTYENHYKSGMGYDTLMLAEFISFNHERKLSNRLRSMFNKRNSVDHTTYFAVVSIIKYIARAGRKDDVVRELTKIKNYLDVMRRDVKIQDFSLHFDVNGMIRKYHIVGSSKLTNSNEWLVDCIFNMIDLDKLGEAIYRRPRHMIEIHEMNNIKSKLNAFLMAFVLGRMESKPLIENLITMAAC